MLGAQVDKLPNQKPGIPRHPGYMKDCALRRCRSSAALLPTDRHDNRVLIDEVDVLVATNLLAIAVADERQDPQRRHSTRSISPLRRRARCAFPANATFPSGRILRFRTPSRAEQRPAIEWTGLDEATLYQLANVLLCTLRSIGTNRGGICDPDRSRLDTTNLRPETRCLRRCIDIDWRWFAGKESRLCDVPNGPVQSLAASIAGEKKDRNWRENSPSS